MEYVVTGSAGFVGSHVCQALLERGHEVDGVDAFTDYYDRSAELPGAPPDAVVPLLSNLGPEMRVMLSEVEAAGARWVDVEPLGPTPSL